MKALGLVVSEKKIFLCFDHCKSMGANDPRGGAIFDPRGMIGRIYKQDHYTLLHTKYEGSGPCGFGEEDFFMFWFKYIYFQILYRNNTKTCNQRQDQNESVNAYLVLFLFMFCPITPPGRGLYGPQGHSWQDL